MSNRIGMNVARTGLVCLVVLAACVPLPAASISVNMQISTNDNNSVDPDESAVTLPAGLNVSGQYWNGILLRDSSAGAPTTFTAATQGGNSITLNDHAGSPAAVMTSSGSFYSEFSDATDGTNRGVTGEAGLVQSYVNLNDNESITISGLGGAFCGDTYKVVLFCEAGDIARTMGLRVVEGPGGNDVDFMRWYRQTTSPDGDVDDDGLVEWVLAVGATSGDATQNGNYFVADGLRADSFTIYGSNVGGRSIINGFQVISNVPEPITLALLGLGSLGLGGYIRRRRA